MTHCQHCGAMVPSAFCPQCGAPAARHIATSSPLQKGLSIGSMVLSVLAMVVAGALYFYSEYIWEHGLPDDPYPELSSRLYDLGWVILWAGGGVALALAIWAFMKKGKGRLLAGIAAALAAVAITLGFVMAA